MPAPTVSLYFAPGSSSIFPHFLLYHCHIPFTPQAVRLSGASNLANINDKKQVPVLIVDGKTITENPAIAHAINHLAPDRHLFGHTSDEFIRVCEWMNWISASLHAQTWSPYMRPWRFTADESAEAQAAVKSATERNVRERFARLEAKLDAKGPWTLGENFTAVDGYLLPFFRVGRDILGADMAKDYPKWTSIAERLLEAEAGKKVLNDEGIARSSTS